MQNLADYKRDNGGAVRGFAGGEFEENGNALLKAECDILIPAALENQLTTDIASRVKAKLVAKAANGPVTFGADEILRSRSVFVMPDFY